MVRIVDLQEVNASSIDSSDYFVISHLNANVGTYGTARVAAGQFYQFLNGPPPGTNLTSTDALPEGLSNLYYTDERARTSISVSGSLSYDPFTGVISYTQPTNISTFTNNAGYLTSSGVTSLIDSAYVNERVSTVDSAQVLAIVDPLYVGIGGDSMTGNLWVDGEIYASGNITGYGSFSDLTLKENLIQIEDALEKVTQLTGYTFNYIGHSERVAGLIAQEVEEVHPEVVYQTPDNKKAIYYGNLMGLIVEAIKEIKSDLDDIKEKIK